MLKLINALLHECFRFLSLIFNRESENSVFSNTQDSQAYWRRECEGGNMRFFIFEQAGDACAGPCRELVIILFSTPVNNTKGTGANYVRRPLIHDTACGG